MQYKVQEPEFLHGAKQSYVTRRVPRTAIQGLLGKTIPPETGDLVLARVQWLGQIDVIDDSQGYPVPLYQDDCLILAYGNHQDLDQYDAVLPGRLTLSDLTTSGGLVSSIKCWHHTLSYPTRLEPLGLLADAYGNRLNLLRFGIQAGPVQRHALTYATVGAGISTLQDMVGSLARRGQRVGVLQITGTSSAHHQAALREHGAEWVVDFADVGFASTYLLPSHELLGIFISLAHHLNQQGATTIVVQIQGPLKQRESRLLIGSPLFRASMDGLLVVGEDGACQVWEADQEQSTLQKQVTSGDPGPLVRPAAPEVSRW